VWRARRVSDSRYETLTIAENTAGGPRILVRGRDAGAQRFELAARAVQPALDHRSTRRAAGLRRASRKPVSLRARERAVSASSGAAHARARRAPPPATRRSRTRRRRARSTSTVPPPQKGSNTESGNSAIRSRAASACMPAG
jgi:hypothetical protein